MYFYRHRILRFTSYTLWCLMKHVLAKKNFLLLHADGSIIYPLSKFITDRFGNPHTRELAAQSLRVFYRFCSAHHIDLSLLAVEGRCLAYNQARQLADLCYRPLSELEKLSDGQIVRLTSSKAGKRPQDLTLAVEPNTAKKRLNHIATYLDFYREVFLAPNIRSNALRQQLKEDYDRVAHQLKATITGTKQGHHHDIRSLPSDKFLAIIRAVYKCTDELFVSETGKPSRTNLRDRAMVLLACEGLRPGTIGNIARADFRLGSNHLVIKDNRGNRPQTTTNTPVLKLGASTQVNSASETMIELWPFTVSAIQDYIDTEREAILSQHLQNRSLGFLFLNEKGKPIKHGSGANYGQRHANLPARRLSSRSQNSCPDFGQSLPLSSQTS